MFFSEVIAKSDLVKPELAFFVRTRGKFLTGYLVSETHISSDNVLPGGIFHRSTERSGVLSPCRATEKAREENRCGYESDLGRHFAVMLSVSRLDQICTRRGCACMAAIIREYLSHPPELR
jgi:hypothetical protein